MISGLVLKLVARLMGSSPVPIDGIMNIRKRNPACTSSGAGFSAFKDRNAAFPPRREEAKKGRHQVTREVTWLAQSSATLWPPQAVRLPWAHITNTTLGFT